MIIKPNWPLPSHIKAYTTLRFGGVSAPPYADFNLATHVGDLEQNIQQNRIRLQQLVNLPSEPIWLEQTHSNHIIEATADNRFKNADAAYSTQQNQVCVILTADCLPILLSDRDGTTVAAIHAGWRGLLNGIIGNTIKTIKTNNQTFSAWLGPAISQIHYETSAEVRDLFITQNPDNAIAFKKNIDDRWLCDLYSLARIQLKEYGVMDIYGGDRCTYAEKDYFYSYRRDGNKTGRMASLIWIS